MAKLVYLPPWLVSSLSDTELQEFITCDKPELFIASKEDLVNYHVAQIEFFKFNFLGLYNTLTLEKINGLFQHQFPNLPELHIYYEGKCDSEVCMSRLIQSSLPVDHVLGFYVNASRCGNVTYVMGTTAPDHQASKDGFVPVTDRCALATAIMRSCYYSFRVEDGSYDMGRPFRNHPLQSQLYLSNLMQRT